MSSTPDASPRAAGAPGAAATPQTLGPELPAVAAGGTGSAGYSPFVPLLIVLISAVGWSSFQYYQLQAEGTALKAAQANQDAAVQQAQRVRQTLDALAAQTKRLADSGNPNAKTVVDELGRRGITINPQAAASAARP